MNETRVPSAPATGSTHASAETVSAPLLQDRVKSLRLPSRQTSPSSSGAAWLVVVLLLGLSVYTSLGGTIPFVPRPLQPAAPAKSSDPVTADTETQVAPSETTTAAPSNTSPASMAPAPGKIVLESKGYIIPEQQILVSPQVSGRIIELNFEAGQTVHQGEILAVLDSTEYKADYERAVAQVAAANERQLESQRGSRPDEIRQSQAELAEARTQLEQARRTYERKRELFEQKIVTPQDLDESESEYQALVRRVEKLTAMTQLIIDGPRDERKRIADAELKAAQAELVRAQWKLDNTIIRAPISGTILKKNAELGNLVNPIAFNGSFSLCDIADLSKLEVELDVQERDIAKVQANQRCLVRAEAFPERKYQGYVSRLMPIANRAKGAVPVRVRIAVPVEEQGQFLKPEMGANVTFFAETIDPAGWQSSPSTISATDTPAAPTEPKVNVTNAPAAADRPMN